MHCKGNCARPLVRNVRSVVNKVILQSSVIAIQKVRKFTWSKKNFTFIASVVKIKLSFH